MRTFSAVLLLLPGIVPNPLRAESARPIHILVPAYANPCCGGGPDMWRALIAAARDPRRNFELAVILNPASGPGKRRDPNYLSADGKSGPIAELRAAGTKLFGYVATGYGKRSDRQIKTDIAGYLETPALYKSHVDGIFFDELSNDLADVPRHKTLVAYVKSSGAEFRTIGNPGVTGTVNRSGQTDVDPSAYAAVFDMLMTFEHDGKTYRDRYMPPAYLNSSNKRKYAHVLHSQDTWSKALLALAKQRGADFLYVTDDLFGDPAKVQPYDRLPS